MVSLSGAVRPGNSWHANLHARMRSAVHRVGVRDVEIAQLRFVAFGYFIKVLFIVPPLRLLVVILKLESDLWFLGVILGRLL